MEQVVPVVVGSVGTAGTALGLLVVRHQSERDVV